MAKNYVSIHETVVEPFLKVLYAISMVEYSIFIFKYTPFWAIPLIIIGLNFGYLYWLKSLKRASTVMFIMVGLCFITLIVYFWIGGAPNCSKFILSLVSNFD